MVGSDTVSAVGVLLRLAVKGDKVKDSRLPQHISCLRSVPRIWKTYPVGAAVGQGYAVLIDHEALAAPELHGDDGPVCGRVQLEERA